MGAKTKISWAESTWNPVTGCLGVCEYCYARRMVRRFAKGYKESGELHSDYKNPSIEKGPYPYGFDPTLRIDRLAALKAWRKPRNVFVCSMADLFGVWIPDSWIQDVFEACAAAPQHRYMFLTKHPSRYKDLYGRGFLPRSENHWYGATITKGTAFIELASNYNKYVSIEPIIGSVEFLSPNICPPPNWIIVGAMTGPQARRYPVKREWIESIADACRKRNIPLFMKGSLRNLMGEKLIQEFPW